MRKDRYKKRHFHVKSLTLVLALALSCVLLVCGVVGGTLSWLIDDTDPVVNTFTTSDIEVRLEETDSLNLKMIPGCTITKDPKAWVTEGSEDCYLFVLIEESDNFEDYMAYAIADGWNPLPGVDNVYYRICDSAEEKGESRAYQILKNDQVSVKDSVTKEMMNEIITNADSAPTLTFTAYASQLKSGNNTSFDPGVAWKNVKDPTGANSAPGSN